MDWGAVLLDSPVVFPKLDVRQWARLARDAGRRYAESDSIVLHNSSSDCPGGIRYLPVDARTAEHFDFGYHGKLIEPHLDPISRKPGGERVCLPLKLEATITPSWFWTKTDYLLHSSVRTTVDWYQRARGIKANLLLNVGSDADGQIPDCNRTYLVSAARQFRL